MCLKSPHRFRSTWGPFSRYFSGSHVCQTCDGSTTWSSTLMIFGSSSIGAKATAVLTWTSVLWVERLEDLPLCRALPPRSLEVRPQPGERHLGDAPAAVDLLVLLVVVAGAVQLTSVGPFEPVLHGPDSRGGRSRRQLDLGHVAVVDGDDVAQDFSKARHEVVGALDDAASRVSRVDVDVTGEHLAHPVPVLGVHQPEVASLELLYGLDVVHARHGRSRGPLDRGPGSGSALRPLVLFRLLRGALLFQALARLLVLS